MTNLYLEKGQSSAVLIFDARLMFNQTGVMVDKNQSYCIEIIEEIEPLCDLSIKVKDFDGFRFPLAWLFRPRLKGVNYFSMCGGIGNDDASMFWIGKKLTFTPPQDGPLFLFINDYKTNYTYKNNKGRMSYNIKRIS